MVFLSGSAQKVLKVRLHCIFPKCILVFDNSYLVSSVGCGNLQSLGAYIYLIHKFKFCASVHFFGKLESSVTVNSVDIDQNDKFEVTNGFLGFL